MGEKVNMSPGMHDGMGAVVFLMHYARAFHDEPSEQAAGDILEHLLERIGPDMSYGYASGLAGLGSGMIYLHRQGFIEWDDHDFFAGVDEYLGDLIPLFPSADIGLAEGLLGPGRYFLFRAAQNADVPLVGDALKGVLHALGKPYQDVEKLESVLDFLCDLYQHGILPEQTEPLISLYEEQLLHVVHHCLMYRAYAGRFSLLSAASLFQRLAEVTGRTSCREIAHEWVQRAPGRLYTGRNDRLFAEYLSRKGLMPSAQVRTVTPEEFAAQQSLTDSPEPVSVRGLKDLYIGGVVGDELFTLLPLSYWNHGN